MFIDILKIATKEEMLDLSLFSFLDQLKLEDQLEGIEQFLRHENKKVKLPIEETFVIEKQKPKVKQHTSTTTTQNDTRQKPNTAKKVAEKHLTRSNTLPVKINKDARSQEYLNQWDSQNAPRKHTGQRVNHKKGVFITSLANVYSSESDKSDNEGEEKKSTRYNGQGRQDKLTVYLQKAQHTTQDALKQLTKSKAVIEELHKNYDEVEHRNEELKTKLVHYEKRLHHIEDTIVNRSTTGGDLELKTQKSAERIDRNLCEQILHHMMEEVKKRQTVLGKKVGPVPKENKALRLRRGQMIQTTRQGRPEETSVLRKKLEELASLLNVYTQQEKLVTHKLGVAKRQKKAIRQLVEDASKDAEGTNKDEKKKNTKPDDHVVKGNDSIEAERNTCYRMMCAIEKQVKEKKQRLRMSNPGLRPPAAESSGITETDPNQPALTSKMNDLQSEIRQYIDIQHATSQHQKEEFQLHQRQYEQKLKASEKQVSLLQKQLQDANKQAYKIPKKSQTSERPGKKLQSDTNKSVHNIVDTPDISLANTSSDVSISSPLVGNQDPNTKGKQTKYLDKFKQNKENKKRALVRPMVRTLEVELPPEKTGFKRSNNVS